MHHSATTSASASASVIIAKERKRKMASDEGVTESEIERLLVNEPDFDRISTYTRRFNPIRVMRMESMEIRHSAILSWLMDPAESHGLGDSFLRAFIAGALRGDDTGRKPTALDVAEEDLRYSEIRREWQNIDILVLSRKQGWAFVIENKFYSSQHSNQLQRYRSKVEALYGAGSKNSLSEKQLKVRGIFLTLEDEEPKDGEYARIRYADICQLLEQLIEQNYGTLSQEVRTFLRHYLRVIKEATGMDEKMTQMQALARKLYTSHRRVIDFIVEHGRTTDFTRAMEQVFGKDGSAGIATIDGQEFYIHNRGDDFLDFIPDRWRKALTKPGLVWEGCEKYADGGPIGCRIRLFRNEEGDGSKGKLILTTEVGPVADTALRLRLIDVIESSGVSSFGTRARRPLAKYSRFLKPNNVPIDNVADHLAIAAAASALLGRATGVFDQVAEVLEKADLNLGSMPVA